MIRTKDEFRALSERGLLGNYLRSWDSAAEMRKAGYRGPVTIRARDKQSPWFISVAFADNIEGEFALIDAKGGPGPEAFYVQEIPAPDLQRVVNFEAYFSALGLELTYETYTTNPLRGIHQRGKTMFGYRALLMLRALLDAWSWEMLEEIWDEHPTSIIEATEFSKPVGAFNKNLVIWEVRDY